MQKKSLMFISFMLVLFVFSMSLVAAQRDPFAGIRSGSGSGASAVFDPVKDMFASWQDGDLSINIAKYVFWLLLTLVIFSILLYIPFLTKLGKWNFLLAVLIAFLSTAYLTPSDVYSALASYGALGIVLSAAIPFVILLFFSIQISKEGGAGGKILSKFIWAAFVLFLVWKLFQGAFFCEIDGGRCISLWEGGAYLLFIIGSILWIFFFEKMFLKSLYKEEFEQSKTSLEKNLQAQRAKREAEARDFYAEGAD
ncbi:hypothetical protein COU60_01860 [Candidatus Pacearchaeota archaeon CG10_big_fil_rev_8_21_14_0_10_34_76]|nr:MAG: hypothetical protein COU60_01860 [Candidatus Pacearchaeota archaeon CG10_big_fil_rev_8_21_14_0_10_34_76]